MKRDVVLQEIIPGSDDWIIWDMDYDCIDFNFDYCKQSLIDDIMHDQKFNHYTWIDKDSPDSGYIVFHAKPKVGRPKTGRRPFHGITLSDSSWNKVIQYIKDAGLT